MSTNSRNNKSSKHISNSLTNEFDWVFYCSYYSDLKKAGINTEKLALKHYSIHGQKEGRITNKSMINHKELKPINELINESDMSFDGIVLKEIDGNLNEINLNLFLDKGFPIFNYREKIYSYDI